jgi:uncharacterized membrane protein YfcA
MKQPTINQRLKIITRHTTINTLALLLGLSIAFGLILGIEAVFSLNISNEHLGYLMGVLVILLALQTACSLIIDLIEDLRLGGLNE